MAQRAEQRDDGRILAVDAALKSVNLGIATAMVPVGIFFLVRYGIISFAFITGVFTYWMAGLAFARPLLGLHRWNIGLVVVMAICAIGASATSGGSASPILFFAGIIAIVGRAFFPSRVLTITSGTGIVALVGLIDVLRGDDLAVISFLSALVLASYLPFIIDRLVTLEEVQRRRAVLDSLTGCLNRHALDARSAELEAQSGQTGLGLAAIMFDIDFFKSVNDRHGHAVGDRVLTEVAYVARKHLRRFELLYRLGGEEFCVLLPGVDADRATRTAERLRRAIESASTDGVQVTASFGVAVADSPFDVDDVLNHADVQLFQAKSTGRNRVCPPPVPATERSSSTDQRSTTTVVPADA